jgi:hypothetical protein
MITLHCRPGRSRRRCSVWRALNSDAPGMRRAAREAGRPRAAEAGPSPRLERVTMSAAGPGEDRSESEVVMMSTTEGTAGEVVGGRYTVVPRPEVGGEQR